jgi:hypothetical protein
MNPRTTAGGAAPLATLHDGIIIVVVPSNDIAILAASTIASR